MDESVERNDYFSGSLFQGDVGESVHHPEAIRRPVRDGCDGDGLEGIRAVAEGFFL